MTLRLLIAKVRAVVKSPAVYKNFLRCLSLYNRELLALNELLLMANPFLAKCPELHNWFKDFVGVKHESATSYYDLAHSVAPKPNEKMTEELQVEIGKSLNSSLISDRFGVVLSTPYFGFQITLLASGWVQVTVQCQRIICHQSVAAGAFSPFVKKCSTMSGFLSLHGLKTRPSPAQERQPLRSVFTGSRMSVSRFLFAFDRSEIRFITATVT